MQNQNCPVSLNSDERSSPLRAGPTTAMVLTLAPGPRGKIAAIATRTVTSVISVLNSAEAAVPLASPKVPALESGRTLRCLVAGRSAGEEK